MWRCIDSGADEYYYSWLVKKIVIDGLSTVASFRMRCQTLVRKLIFYKGLGLCGGGAAGGNQGKAGVKTVGENRHKRAWRGNGRRAFLVKWAR